ECPVGVCKRIRKLFFGDVSDCPATDRMGERYQRFFGWTRNCKEIQGREAGTTSVAIVDDGNERHSGDVNGTSIANRKWTEEGSGLSDSSSHEESLTGNASGNSEVSGLGRILVLADLDTVSSQGAPRDVQDLVYEAWRMIEAAVESRNIEKLQEVVVFAETAADACSANPVLHSHALDSLGRARWAMFEETGIREHMERAVEAFEEAVKICPRNHSDRPRLLGNLACVLEIRFETSANTEDVERSIALLEEALALGQPQDRSLQLADLATSLYRRFEVTANSADLDRCVVLREEALELASPSDRPSRLWNLGGFLHTRFENTANMSDLEKSVAVLQEAVALSKSDEDRRESRNSLGISLRTHYNQTRNVADLDQSITLHEEALQLCSAMHVDRPMYLNNLAASLGDRFRPGKNIANLDR
ncbi:hypothetical protein FRB99_003927, partial [Tulasnella sp. 403]